MLIAAVEAQGNEKSDSFSIIAPPNVAMVDPIYDFYVKNS
jgi:hypothetical protein